MRFIKRIFLLLYFCTGMPFFYFIFFRRRGRILTYHRINDDSNDFLSISPHAFERHMAYLSRRYTVVPLERMAASLADGASPETDTVAITFDDGYRDNYLYAFPVLRKYGFPATIFLVTSFVGTSHVFEWDRHQRAQQDKYLMGWDEVEEMARTGISFGAHTQTHPVLTAISLEKAREEITGSAYVLKKRLGRVTAFAYPRGERRDVNHTLKQMVRETGVACAVTTVSGTNTRHSDIFGLKRWAVEKPDASLWAFRMLMAGGSSLFHQLTRHSRFAQWWRKKTKNKGGKRV
ncbi:MAG: polysaccharide deacetylase family protein [Spirochaetales bacterium]|nr:polysaccharide deacetylase family protein [Spirochaetales bacterium]